MKANEFVKKFGWGEAKKVVTKETDLISICTLNFYEDLKRLVESHELVESFGGLEKAKEMKIGDFPLGWVVNTSRLEKAIADVESCQ